MAERNNQNFLNFTKLTYAEIIQQINDRLKDDPKFENFRESAIAQTLVEIFGGATDMTNYYLERRAEEQFFETLMLRSSAISLAKNIGYVVSRPVPASTAISMTLKGPLPAGVQAGDQIVIQKEATNFKHKGLNYVPPKTYVYTITQGDVDNGVGNGDFVKVIEGAVRNLQTVELNSLGNIPTSAVTPITLRQGELKTKTFLASSPTSLRGQNFQKYKIPDTTFSNMYGDEDISFSNDTEEYTLAEGFTKVGIGIDKDTAFQDENLYEISRRTVLTSDTVLDALAISANAVQVCGLQTTLDEGVQIEFADGNTAKKGPITINDNLYVQYLSTSGAEANQVGVIGDKVTTDRTFMTSISNLNVTNNIEFKLARNITGGANFEDIESIKFNAPGIYQALDRLVTARDYTFFLKSLTNPIDVKNAIAWGEQEEVEAAKKAGEAIFAQKKLFNVVLFSVLGELYYFLDSGDSGARTTSGANSNTNLNNAVLEGEEFTNFNRQDYFNILVAGSSSDGTGIIDQIGDVQTLSASNVFEVTQKVTKRSQITTKNVYIAPTIQKFTLTGDVYVKNLVNLNDIKRKINNKVNSFLNEKADYNTPVYISNIVEVIESSPEILNADVKFLPQPVTSADAIVGGPLADDYNVNTWPTSAAIISTMNQELSAYVFGTDGTDANPYTTPLSAALFSSNFDIKELSSIALESQPWTKDVVTSNEARFRMQGFNERSFYTRLMKNIWVNMEDQSVYGTYRDSNDFQQLMLKLNNELKHTIRNGMLDEYGNISNFSLPAEVAQIEIGVTYRYR